jgi:hypothetical protein
MCKEFAASRETFAKGDSSIRVQPDRGSIEVKGKPRGGSRGAVTHKSFRRLVQEEQVS